MNNIGVVVLHYQTANDTIACVDSFLKEKTENKKLEIVIVDNHSNNNSYDKLNEKYCAIDNVYLVKTDSNLGFANGNNFGVKKLYEIHATYDYIICCNNDTFIQDTDFLNKVGQIIDETGCDVLGPDVIRVSDNAHQNPLKATDWNVRSVEKRIIEFKLKILLFSLFPFFCKDDKKNIKETSNVDANHIQLHGSFIIFANGYLKSHRDVFYNKTFLYLEEDILFLRCKMENFIIRYDDRIVIYHNHSSATNSINKKISKRKIAFLRNQIKSLHVLKEIISDYGDKNKTIH